MHMPWWSGHISKTDSHYHCFKMKQICCKTYNFSYAISAMFSGSWKPILVNWGLPSINLCMNSHLGAIRNGRVAYHTLATLPTNSPECWRGVWSRNGWEGCSGMLHDVITQMVYYLGMFFFFSSKNKYLPGWVGWFRLRANRKNTEDQAHQGHSPHVDVYWHHVNSSSLLPWLPGLLHAFSQHELLLWACRAGYQPPPACSQVQLQKKKKKRRGLL